MKYVFRVVNNIGCYTSKADGKCVEINGVVVRSRNPIEKGRDVLAPEESATFCVAHFFLLAQRECFGQDIGVLLLAQLQVLVA